MSLRPLRDETPYCQGKPCPDYAQSVERIRQLAAPGAGPRCRTAAVGRCGWYFRYVAYSDRLSRAGIPAWMRYV